MYNIKVLIVIIFYFKLTELTIFINFSIAVAYMHLYGSSALNFNQKNPSFLKHRENYTEQILQQVFLFCLFMY